VSGVAFRVAARDDLAQVVALLADDDLGRGREDANDPVYAQAFARIEADANNEILVGVAETGEIVACLQLTLIPGLTRRGATRGASLAQLTSDATRGRAHAFYARLGFAPSHLGFKRALTQEDAR